ncbi:MAG: hypothetical protein ABR963_04145 [Acidimicrobiales bacterium]
MSAASSTSSFSFQMKRWSSAERTTAIATLVLFISLFLPWYTYNFGLGSVSQDGLWHGWMYIVFLLSLAILAYLVSIAGFSELPFKMPIAGEQFLLIASVVNLVFTVLSFVDKPGGIGLSGIGWGFGAFIGLVAAVVAALPLGMPALRARRK